MMSKRKTSSIIKLMILLNLFFAANPSAAQNPVNANEVAATINWRIRCASVHYIGQSRRSTTGS
jgi:hypothetical protein